MLKRRKLNPVSKKRGTQLQEWYVLRDKLMEKANSVSELSGKQGFLEPHHLDGREGGLLLDPFNVILVTKDEHQAIQEYRSGYTKDYLLWLVKSIRIKQGF